MKIGVSGASGQLGQRVVAELLSRVPAGDVVAISRTPEASGEVEARAGDYDHPETLAGAYAGLDRVLLIPAGDGRAGTHARRIEAAVDAAVAAGVGQIFLLSKAGTRDRPEPAFGAGYWAGERRILRSDVAAWTILRMNFFAESLGDLARWFGPALGYLPTLGENRMGFVSRADVAAACAGALATPGHRGATYNLSGPDRVPGPERAALLGELLGRPLESRVVAAEELRTALLPSGAPAGRIDFVISMLAAQADGGYDLVTGDVERLAGRPPRSLRDALLAPA